MHVRHVVDDLDIARHRLASHNFVIGIAGRNLEQKVGRGTRNNHLVRKLLREDQPDASTIGDVLFE